VALPPANPRATVSSAAGKHEIARFNLFWMSGCAKATYRSAHGKQAKSGRQDFLVSFASPVG
jgi:hypothetical protein